MENIQAKIVDTELKQFVLTFLKLFLLYFAGVK